MRVAIICDDLRDLGLAVSLERVRRRMKCLGLRGIQKWLYLAVVIDLYSRKIVGLGV